jgi:hypothetical protein
MNIVKFFRKPSFLLFFFIILASHGVKAQAFDFNSFFSEAALGFDTPDSNNMIYDEVKDATQMVKQLDSIFPFKTTEFYGAYPGIKTDDTITYLQGLHNELPTFNSKAIEVKGKFTLNNKTDYWYSYYKKSTQDTTTAILIFPGTGDHQSFHIANDETDNYHDADCLIKEKALSYGDVYIIVKPNEDFRSIWTTISDLYYNKLDYDILGPYTTLMGKNWAANLYIELLAQLKYLKSKYKKVIVMGLSNGGLPVLVCGLEAGVDGINCASGLSVTSYNGFPVTNNENPFFSGLLDYYSLENIKSKIRQSDARVLFTYGSGDSYTNAYENTNHALQNYLNSPVQTCNADFFYDFSGHTFSCAGLDSLVKKVNGSPQIEIVPVDIPCTRDSLALSIKLTGQPPFNFDLFKNDTFYQHFSSNERIFPISLKEAGNFQIMNLIDANNIPVCISKKFTYEKPVLPNILGTNVLGFDCATQMQRIEIKLAGTPPFQIKTDLNLGTPDSDLIFQTNNIKLPVPNGQYTIFSIKDSSGCSETINFPIKIVIDSLGFKIAATKDCINNKYIYHIELNGKPPFVLNYNLNNKFYTKDLPARTTDWSVSSGYYYLISATDSNNCSIPIEKHENLNGFLKTPPVLETKDSYLVATKTNYNYSWYKNRVLIGATTENQLIVQGNGDYYAVLTDSDGCTYTTNSITLNEFTNVNIFPNPSDGDFYILIDDKFSGSWKYQIFDYLGKKVLEGESSSIQKRIDFRSARSGVYNVIIEYNFKGKKIKKIIRIIKGTR